MTIKLTGTKFTLGPDFTLGANQTLRLAGSVNVHAFGAVGDGVTDDTAAIQTAITAAGSGRLTLTKGATYKITDALNVSASGLAIQGNGAVIDGSSIATATALSQRFAINVSGSLGAAWAVDADIAEGSVTVSTTLAPNLAAGDLVLLYSNVEKFPAGTGGANYIGAIHRVRSVDSATQITLFDGAFFSYAAASQARIKKLTPIRNVSIENLTVRMGGANKAHCGIQIIYADRCEIRNCTVYDTEDTGVLIGYAFGGGVYDSEIYNCLSPGDGSSGVSGNTGYGVCAASATRNVQVARNSFRNCRHAVAGGGAYPSIATLVTANVVAGNRADSYTYSAALDCHEDCIGWVFDGNHISGNNSSTGTQGILVRGSRTRVVNNIINASATYGVYVRNYDSTSSSTGTVISGNVITAARSGGIVVQGLAGSLQNEIVIANNLIQSPQDEGIMLYGTSYAVISGNVIRGVTTSGKSGIRLVGTAATSGNQCAQVVISGNIVDTPALHGVRVDYGESVTVTGNRVISAGQHGLYFANSNDITASDNKVSTSGAAYSGVYLTATTKAALAGNTTKQLATASGSASGISLLGATTDVSVIGGIYDGFVYGVRSASPADYITVCGVNGRGCTNSVDVAASANTAAAGNL
jgi:parallel beta-helix repeat protein